VCARPGTLVDDDDDAAERCPSSFIVTSTGVRCRRGRRGVPDSTGATNPPIVNRALQTRLERDGPRIARGAESAHVVVAPVVHGQFEQRIPERLLVGGRVRVRPGLDVPDQVCGHVVGRARPEDGHRLRGLVHVERRRTVDDVRGRSRVHQHGLRVAGYHANVSEELGDLQVDRGL